LSFVGLIGQKRRITNDNPQTAFMLHHPTIFSAVSDLIAAESTRHGGISPAPFASLNLGLNTADDLTNVTENRRRFFTTLGVDPQQVVSSHQVHGTEMLTATEPGRFDGFDAFVTDRPGLLLTVTVADCVPVLLCDPVRRVVAAAHAGWRGTVGQIVRLTLERMQTEFGTNPADCLAWVGTCIDDCSFEVGADVAGHFSTDLQTIGRDPGKYFVDLKRANVRQLTEAGLPLAQIEVSPYSTVLHNADYFSHRHERGQTGRMLAGIGFR
jgi:polyphenol oxidase